MVILGSTRSHRRELDDDLDVVRLPVECAHEVLRWHAPRYELSEPRTVCACQHGRPLRERDWLVTVPRRDGSVIYMVFVAPQSYFDRFQPTFATMLKSVQF